MGLLRLTFLSLILDGQLFAVGQTSSSIVSCPIPDGTIPEGTAPWIWPENREATRVTRNKGKYKVLMVRHAESIANTMDPYFITSCTTSRGLPGCNHSFDPRDSPLSAKGVSTARAQGQSKTLASLEAPDIILISPLLRTMQTAMNVIPKVWLDAKATESTPLKMYFMPWLTEVAAPSGNMRDGGTWAQRIYQNWGHAPSSWFNASCPSERISASLDYNNTRATCMGYKSVEGWIKKYVNLTNSGGYQGFYNKTFFDFWERNEASFWAPSAQEGGRNVDGIWQLLGDELRNTKVMIVTHHQFLRSLIDWPENSTVEDPFFRHDVPKFLCMEMPRSKYIVRTQ